MFISSQWNHNDIRARALSSFITKHKEKEWASWKLILNEATCCNCFFLFWCCYFFVQWKTFFALCKWKVHFEFVFIFIQRVQSQLSLTTTSLVWFKLYHLISIYIFSSSLQLEKNREENAHIWSPILFEEIKKRYLNDREQTNTDY